MTIQLINILVSTVSLLAGGMIGSIFGVVQDAARRRNEKRERSGKLKSVWTLMPGSGARVAYFLLVLLLVQLLCPLLFVAQAKWWVSAGIAVGYGAMLLRQMRQRQSQRL